MLGQLLEFTVHARSVAATLEFYESLGFQSLPVGDVPTGPYAAMWDGSIALGLYEHASDGPAPTFVRPELKMHLRGLRRLGVELEFAELADEEFNRAGFRDPNGQLVALVEARTFSPATRGSSRVSACGEFLEWSVPTHSTAASAAFWTRLGLERVAAADHPHPWVRLAGHGLVVGFHEGASFAPGLTFRAPDLGARIEYLQAKSLPVQRGAPPAAPGERAATLLAPEKVPMYLLDAGD